TGSARRSRTGAYRRGDWRRSHRRPQARLAWSVTPAEAAAQEGHRIDGRHAADRQPQPHPEPQQAAEPGLQDAERPLGGGGEGGTLLGGEGAIEDHQVAELAIEV